MGIILASRTRNDARSWEINNMALQKEQRLAVLIDADNASKGNLKAIMDEVAKYGVPTIKHAYGDWAKLAGWKDVLLEIGAVPVQQYAYTTGKNATDAALIIEAMDILHADNVEGFVIVSSDSDFTPRALRLRESGKKGYGIGEKKTPKPFITACDKFIYVEILADVQPEEKPDGKALMPSQAQQQQKKTVSAKAVVPCAMHPGVFRGEWAKPALCIGLNDQQEASRLRQPQLRILAALKNASGHPALRSWRCRGSRLG